TPPESPMRRRWFAQRRRYTYNQLIYLLPHSEYPRLLGLIPEMDEFREVRTVLGALAAGSATEVLPFPGKVATAFCQLWPQQYPTRQPRIRWPADPGRAEAEVIAHLALRLSVTPPPRVLAAISSHTPGARLLVELCGDSKTDRASIGAFTYLHQTQNPF